MPTTTTPLTYAEALSIYRAISKVTGTPYDRTTAHTPEQWAERGEDAHPGAVLIITHDGGDHAPAFNLDYMAYPMFDALVNALHGLGFWTEAVNCWHSTVRRS